MMAKCLIEFGGPYIRPDVDNYFSFVVFSAVKFRNIVYLVSDAGEGQGIEFPLENTMPSDADKQMIYL